MPTDLCIVIATWNERLNLPDLTDQLRKLFSQAILLIVDDNSPDGTGVWAGEQSSRDSKFFLLSRSRREGLGSAAIDGLVKALEYQTRWIATMDSDFSHSPADLARMFEKANTAGDDVDVIIGSRYTPGGKIENWSFHRRLASAVINRVVRFGLGLPVRDTTSALRLYRRATLAKILPGPFHSRSHVYLEELLFRLHRQGANMIEVPITFSDRRQGRSSLSFRSLSLALKELSRLLLFRGRYTQAGRVAEGGKSI